MGLVNNPVMGINFLHEFHELTCSPFPWLVLHEISYEKG